MSATVTADEIVAGLAYGSLSLLLMAEFILRILAYKARKRFLELEAAIMDKLVWRGQY